MNTSRKSGPTPTPFLRVPILYKDLNNFSQMFTKHLTHAAMPVRTSKDVIGKKILPVINIFYLAEECLYTLQ